MQTGDPQGEAEDQPGRGLEEPGVGPWAAASAALRIGFWRLVVRVHRELQEQAGGAQVSIAEAQTVAARLWASAAQRPRKGKAVTRPGGAHPDLPALDVYDALRALSSEASEETIIAGAVEALADEESGLASRVVSERTLWRLLRWREEERNSFR